MKIKKNILFGVLFLLVTLFSFSLVTAMSVTIAIPAASSTISGNTTVNVTGTSVGAGYDWNCTIYAQSTLTANSTWVTLLANTIPNETATSWNGTFDSSLTLEDANNYILNASCNNNTDTIEDTNTAITVDNTVPATPSSLSPSASSTDTDGDVTFSATVTGSRTTSCTLNFVDRNPGASSYTMTHSGSTCTYSLTAIPEETYEYYITASDETNTTNSANTRFNIDIPSGGGISGPPVCGNALCENGEYQGQDYECVADCPIDETNPPVQSNFLLWILIIVGIVIFVVIVYYIAK